MCQLDCWSGIFFALTIFIKPFLFQKVTKPPTLIVQPSSLYGLLNQRVTLQCTLNLPADSNTDELQLGSSVNTLWYKGDHLLNITADPTLSLLSESTHSSLVFTSLQQRHQGVYCCQRTIGGFTINSTTSSVDIAFLGSHFEGPISKTVSAGYTVLMECNPPDGKPRPEIHWFKDDVHIISTLTSQQRAPKLSTNHEHYQIVAYGNLRIDNVMLQDQGNYHCSAENLVGTRTSSKARLTVVRKPRFSITPSNIVVRLEEDIRLPCEVVEDSEMQKIENGDATHVMWLKEDGSGGGNHISDRRAIILMQHGLYIQRASLTDAGRYICRAMNRFSVIEAVAEVTVLSPPEFVLTPPDIVRVTLGQPLILSCHVSGYPIPRLFWKRLQANTFHFPASRRKLYTEERVFVSENGELQIPTIRESDAGVYECRASSWLSRSVSTSRVEVQRLSNQFVPFIVYPPLVHTWIVQVGMTIYLPCQPTIISMPVIWFKNGLRILSGSRHTFVSTNGSLIVERVVEADTANYTCQVIVSENRYAEWSVQLVVTSGVSDNASFHLMDGRPLLHAPKEIRVTSVQETRIGISWDPVTAYHSQSVSYQIEIFPDNIANSLSSSSSDTKDVSTWSTAGANVSSTSFSVGKLQPDHGYWIAVRALNRLTGMVISEPRLTNHVIYTQPQRAVAVRVMSFSELSNEINGLRFKTMTLESLSATEIRVSFEMKGNPDAVQLVDGYIMKYKEVPLSRCALSEEWSEQQQRIIDPCLKSSLQELVSSLKMVDAPFHGQEFQELTNEYQHIVYQRIGRDHDYYASPEEESIQTVLEKLTPMTCYEVQAEPFCDHPTLGRVRGTISRARTAFTGLTVAKEAPKLVLAQWLENGTRVEIRWRRLKAWHWRGVVRSYKIHILTNISTPRLALSKEVEPDLETLHVEHLSPSQRYTIHIAAVTCHGEGVRSSPWHLPAFLQEGADAAGLGLPSLPRLGEDLGTENIRALLQRPWFVVLVILGLLAWIVVVTGVIVLRCRTLAKRRQRRREMFKKMSEPKKKKEKGKNGDGGSSMLIMNTTCLSTNSSYSNGADPNAETKQRVPAVLLQSSHPLSQNHQPCEESDILLQDFLPPSRSSEVSSSSGTPAKSYYPLHPVSLPYGGECIHMSQLDSQKTQPLDATGCSTLTYNYEVPSLLPTSVRGPPPASHLLVNPYATTSILDVVSPHNHTPTHRKLDGVNGPHPHMSSIVHESPLMDENTFPTSSFPSEKPFMSMSSAANSNMCTGSLSSSSAHSSSASATRALQHTLTGFLPPPPNYPPPPLPTHSVTPPCSPPQGCIPPGLVRHAPIQSHPQPMFSSGGHCASNSSESSLLSYGTTFGSSGPAPPSNESNWNANPQRRQPRNTIVNNMKGGMNNMQMSSQNTGFPQAHTLSQDHGDSSQDEGAPVPGQLATSGGYGQLM